MQSHWARPLADLLSVVASLVSLFTNDRARLSTELPHAGDLLYVGHGTADALGSPALFDGVNVAGIGGRIVAVACRSADRLGPNAVEAGTRGYVGFVDDLHVVNAEVLDELIIRNFEPLLTASWSEAEFEERFKAACQGVQDDHFSGRRRRAPDAHIIGSAAQVMKLSVRAL